METTTIIEPLAESEIKTELFSTKVVTSALSIIIPDYMHAYVDTFRKTYDKAYERWPPHINFVFPFISVEEFGNVKTLLEAAFKEKVVASFVMKLDTIDHFVQANGITVHARPKHCPELSIIYDIIINTLGIEKTRDFCAHMTLGQFDKSSVSLAKVNEMKASWGSGLSIPVNKLQLIARSRDTSDRFIIINEVNLCDA